MIDSTHQPDRRAPVDHGWNLDKKVPLSLIFAMLVQAGMVIVAISDIKKDVGEWIKGNAGAGAALAGSLLTGNVPGAVAAEL